MTVPPHRGWHLSEMFDAMERDELQAIYVHRREPAPVRGRPGADAPPPRDARVHRRPGHLPDRDRGARRRRAARVRGLGRERGHRHQLRAARPARPQGARPARRRPRRPLDHLRAGPSDGLRLGLARRRGRLERGPVALAGPRRDVVPAARGARWPAVAVLRREPPRRAVPPQPAVGGPGARQPGAVRAGRPRPAGRQARRRLPDPPDDRPPPRLVQHRRPDRRLHVAAAPRRVARHLARGRRAARPRRRRARLRHVAPRPGRGPDPDRRVAPARAHVHDAPLPGRRRDEPAHDRRHGPQVRHGRVQGDRDPDRQAARAGGGVGGAAE